VLALQGGAEGPAERRRRQARRGLEMLAGLDRLRVGLLEGGVSRQGLDALRRQLGEAEASGDPALDAILADLDLRTAVELAKLERRPAPPAR